ncbi:MAG: DUF2207 domain-containing protein [Acidobacteriaceae bacterium]
MSWFHAVCCGKKSACTTILFLLLFALLPRTDAQNGDSGRSWRIQDFHSDITLHKDGSVEVVERLTVLFQGSFHGIDRSIPTEYPGPKGGNYSLDLSVNAVTDSNGDKLKYQTSHSGRFENIRIYIPGAVNATRVVNIRYSAAAASRFFKDYDEFYWNVTGNDWRVPIDAASAVVHLPKGAHDERAQAFTGSYGSRGRDALVSIQPGQVTVESSNPLSAREGLTLDIALPKGVLSEPSTLTRWWRFLAANSIILLPFWTLAVMFRIKRHIDGKSGVGAAVLSVAAQYEPPPGMSPAECGTLVDDTTDPRDVTSTLIDLAVRGYLKIHEISTKHLLSTSRDYQLELLKQPDASLAPYEQMMLNNIFSSGQTVLVSELRNRFYVVVPKIKESIMAELDRKGMYAVDPQQAFGYLFLGAAIAAAPFLIAVFFFGANFLRSGLWLVGAAVVAAIIMFFFARHLSATTLQGAKTKAQVLGLREFMKRVDEDRLKRMPPDTFEKYLAYAMALGVEQHWAKAFSGIIQNPPSWYDGGFSPGTFSTMYFMSSLGSMVQTTGQAFVAAPQASASGSGFGGGGGGGFSGGGFGGGGGGAF